MTPEEIADVRPRLLAFAEEMLGGLARSDQQAAGELYVRGLLTDGRRKSMVPMAERLGIDHQRLQQFITSSTWDYTRVRANVARWFAASQPVEALVVDDTGFPKDGHGVAVCGPAVLGDAGQDRQLPGRGERAPGERACLVRGGLAAILPGILGRPRAADPVAAAAARRRRELSRIPGQVRHTEKWRLALEMIEEMTGPGGWGLLEQVTVAGGARPVAVADVGYGDNALFREELTAAGWQYVVAVKGTTSAHPAEAVPQTAPYAGRGQPPKAAYPHPPVNLRQLAIAARGPDPAGSLAAGHPDHPRQPGSGHDQPFPGYPGTAQPAATSLARPIAASQPAGCWPNGRPTPASRRITGCPPSPPTLPSKNWCAWPRSAGGSSTTTASSRPAWDWTTSKAAHSPAGTATSPSPPSPRRSAPAAHRPKSPCAGMTLYQVLHELQIVLALILGACPLCCQPLTLDRLAAALAGT